MSNEIWRWADPGGQQRKVQLDELRAGLAGGLMAPNTPVWKRGWSAWRSAHDVPELTASALSAANGVVPNIPPPPLAVVAAQHAYESKGAESFRPPPVEPAGDDEPPPPPAYVPAAVKPAPISSPDSSPDVSGLRSPVRLPASLPTAVGLPPPPGMAALATARRAAGRMPSKPPLPPRREASSAPNDRVEELSGSILLDDGSQPAMPAAVRSAAAVPPPSEPVLHHVVGPGDARPSIATPSNPIDQLRAEIANLRARRPVENTRVLIVGGVVAGSAALVVLAVFITLIRAITGGSSTETPARSATAPRSAATAASAASDERVASAAPTPRAAAVVAARKDPPSSAPVFGACTASGDAKALGWRAVAASGVEASSSAGALAVGFASSPRDGVALSLDPSTLTATATVKTRAQGGDARRVSPLLVQGKLVAVADTDRKGDRLLTRRVVGSSPPIDVGVSDSAVVWAPHGKDSWAKLFALDGDAPVEALRAVPLATSNGIALAFRRGGAIWVGVARGEGVLEAEGALQKIGGLGQAGSPSLAATGDTLVVAWADRAAADRAWAVRWTKVPIGGAPAEARALALPDGDLVGQATSPSVASLGGGRFLLAWADGSASSHRIRAQSFGGDGAPSGAPLALSPSAVNAVQPQATVGPDGKGVVAFLAAKGKAYAVHAAPLSCPVQ